MILLFQWLSSVVSLQVSIAQHLAQKQISSEPGADPASGASWPAGKLTASVLPTVKQEVWEEPDKLLNGTCPQEDTKDVRSPVSGSVSLLNPALSNGESDCDRLPEADAMEVCEGEKLPGTSLLSSHSKQAVLASKTNLTSTPVTSKQPGKPGINVSRPNSTSVLSPKVNSVSAVKVGPSKVVTVNMSSQGRCPILHHINFSFIFLSLSLRCKLS